MEPLPRSQCEQSVWNLHMFWGMMIARIFFSANVCIAQCCCAIIQVFGESPTAPVSVEMRCTHIFRFWQWGWRMAIFSSFIDTVGLILTQSTWFPSSEDGNHGDVEVEVNKIELDIVINFIPWRSLINDELQIVGTVGTYGNWARRLREREDESLVDILISEVVDLSN